MRAAPRRVLTVFVVIAIGAAFAPIVTGRSSEDDDDDGVLFQPLPDDDDGFDYDLFEVDPPEMFVPIPEPTLVDVRCHPDGPYRSAWVRAGPIPSHVVLPVGYVHIDPERIAPLRLLLDELHVLDVRRGGGPRTYTQCLYEDRLRRWIESEINADLGMDDQSDIDDDNDDDDDDDDLVDVVVAQGPMPDLEALHDHRLDPDRNDPNAEMGYDADSDDDRDVDLGPDQDDYETGTESDSDDSDDNDSDDDMGEVVDGEMMAADSESDVADQPMADDMIPFEMLPMGLDHGQQPYQMFHFL